MNKPDPGTIQHINAVEGIDLKAPGGMVVIEYNFDYFLEIELLQKVDFLK